MYSFNHFNRRHDDNRLRKSEDPVSIVDRNGDFGVVLVLRGFQDAAPP